jgi:hypothetical protein
MYNASSQDTGGVGNKDGEVHNFRFLKKSVFFLSTNTSLSGCKISILSSHR